MDGFMTKWHKELMLFYRLKPLLILEGNIFDLFHYPETEIDFFLPEYLEYFLKEMGYQLVLQYDRIDGFTEIEPAGTGNSLKKFEEITSAQTEIIDNKIAVDFSSGEETAVELVGKMLKNEEVASAVIFNMASRYILSADNTTQEQADAFSSLMLSVSNAHDVYSEGRYIRNLCILLVDKVNDLPIWFYKDNPYVKILHIQTPAREERRAYITGRGFENFFVPEIYEKEIKEFEGHEIELEKLQEQFVALTEGFTRLELGDLSYLSENERFSIRDLTKIVDLYRYGVRENPWTGTELRERLKDGERILKSRVKGQEIAVEKTLQVIKRAVAGLSGLQHSSHGKPKGILFFAGPTGTGKTELAKSLAELIFGDERTCIRFDMSEYAAPASDQRLLGAPPGYVGYEAGGQLTNAVREHPFSILLFDEIEKAHDSVMDKFLQILEDGRMTDGQGNTVYFSECVIIFTSNLGIYAQDEVTGRRSLQVEPENAYEEVDRKVRDGISRYFKLQLGRPEILNRIGENIVVFDFIRENTARQIMDSQLEKIIRTMHMEYNVELKVEDSAREKLLELVLANLENGGRGVGNMIEEWIINPLSGYLLDHELLNDASVSIKEITAKGDMLKTVIMGHHD